MDSETVGNVTMQTVERGYMRLTVSGELRGADVHALAAYAAGCRARLGAGEGLACVVIADDMRGIEQDARRALTTERKAKLWDWVAVVGAPFDVQVGIELLIRSLRALDEDAAELCFHDSEVIARAWLAQRR